MPSLWSSSSRKKEGGKFKKFCMRSRLFHSEEGMKGKKPPSKKNLSYPASRKTLRRSSQHPLGLSFSQHPGSDYTAWIQEGDVVAGKRSDGRGLPTILQSGKRTHNKPGKYVGKERCLCSHNKRKESGYPVPTSYTHRWDRRRE